MIRVLKLVLCLLSAPALAQTVVSIPAASGTGIKYTMPARYGINIDNTYNYGDSQLTRNLLQANSVSFAPQIYMSSSPCAAGSNTSQWFDQNIYNPQPQNFWQGATYQVISGANAGATGIVTSSTAAAGGAGVIFNLSPSLSTTCTASGGGDEMIVRCVTPLGSCAGGYGPAQMAGNQINGNVTFETSDLSPNSQSLQALQLASPSQDQPSPLLKRAVDGTNPASSGLMSPWDPIVKGQGSGFFINLNGSYTLTFRAKGTSGAPAIAYSVDRVGTAPYLAGTVNPTVSATPGLGWTDYSFTFTASETGSQAANGEVMLEVTGGTVLLQDLALTEAATGGNTTFLRDAVYQDLLNMHPGMMRLMNQDNWGCTVDAMMTVTFWGRPQCGYSSYLASTQPVSIGYSDFLQAAAAVGARAAWLTISPFSTTQDFINLEAYLDGACGNGNSYTALRCSYGQATPWTTVFPGGIYIEFGNEVWNSSNGENVYGGNGQAYGVLLGNAVAGARASSFANPAIKFVGSGFILGYGAYGWNWTVLTAACAISGGCPDYIGGAPYTFGDMTDLSSPQNIFGPMFAEPVNTTEVGGVTNRLQHDNFGTFGVNGAIYEENMGTVCGLSSDTQDDVNGVVAGLGAGLTIMENALLATRDAGVLVHNIFAYPETSNPFDAPPDIYSGCGSYRSATLSTPLWGTNRFAAGPGSSNIVDRPTGIALALVNQAIGDNLDVLNTAQSATPTYSSPAAQPNPDSTAQITATLTSGSTVLTGIALNRGYLAGYLNQYLYGNGIPSSTYITAYNQQTGTATMTQPATTGGSQDLNAIHYNVAANSSVPYVQAFGFADGSGHYTLIAFNFNLTSNEAIAFSGAAAPTGAVKRTVFTSANITDNNENCAIGCTPTVAYPAPTTVFSPSSDLLPPYSMTTYTWSTNATAPPPPPPFGTLDQAVDSVTSSTIVPQSDSLLVSGWAADVTDGAPLTSVKVYLDGTLLPTPTTGLARLDVADAYGNQAFTNSGYRLVYPAAGISLGAHAVTTIATDSAGQSTTFGPLSFTVIAAPPATHPFGYLDEALDSVALSKTVSQLDSLLVSGWAADVTDGAPLSSVKIYLDGTLLPRPALGLHRPDVAAAYGNSAYANSGYQLLYPAATISPGVHAVTVVATDSLGHSTIFGPLIITVTVGPLASPPFGRLDEAVDNLTSAALVMQSDSLLVGGWVADPTDGAPVSLVRIYLDGTLLPPPAMGLPRTDVAASYANAGLMNSGYQLLYPAAAIAPGAHAVTVVATDSLGRSTTFGPLNIVVIAVPPSTLPFGNLDAAEDSVTFGKLVAQSDSLLVGGWVADVRDGAPLTNVHIYLDGTLLPPPTLGVARPDVAAAFANNAFINSGYQLLYPAATISPGAHAVTVVATDSLGHSTTFGPLNVTVTTTSPVAHPFGSLEEAVDNITSSNGVPQSDSLLVSGWVADLANGVPLSTLQVYLDNTLLPPPALGLARPDIASAIGSSAYANSGYRLLYPAAAISPGAHAVTVVATDSLGRSTTFGPISVSVTAAPSP
jgi:hypothetical protein